MLIWLGQLTRLLDLLVALLHKPVELIGLPQEAASIFIFGFFRRDYGAAGLYEMAKAGLLTNNQLLVAMVTITLFLPCVAQFMVIIKEKGAKIALLVSLFVMFYAFAAGGILNYILRALGVAL